MKVTLEVTETEPLKLEGAQITEVEMSSRRHVAVMSLSHVPTAQLAARVQAFWEAMFRRQGQPAPLLLLLGPGDEITMLAKDKFFALCRQAGVPILEEDDCK